MPQLSLRRIAPIAVLACVLSVPAGAKDKDLQLRPAQIDELFACRTITDPTERLACFDREVGELAAADQAREIVFTDRETAQKARRGLFGFSFPKLGGIFGGDEDEVKNIETVIAAVRADRSGKFTITMEDGAVWAQIDTTRLPRDPKPGDKVEIRTASMGSYFASVNGQRSMRMIRQR
ncbi:MAG TPA: hypothetical protein PKD99_10570 [Sphingopyxis sp.]|nr:hypothetical protein [Sphingopyxis sp.]HMP45539.1 hypothetical protein [Sphingopyxis sp.]HMQ20396.1 hypothetical protein [Sphingopyxis sp.]